MVLSRLRHDARRSAKPASSFPLASAVSRAWFPRLHNLGVVVFTTLVWSATFLVSATAYAKDPAIPVTAAPLAAAPALAAPMARQQADAELRLLVDHLAPALQRKVTGIYVASDTASRDAYAMAACDDDGDYVVVVSDPLLALLDWVAQATAEDELTSTRKLSEYAAFLAREQLPNTRLLAPPAGFFDAAEEPSRTATAELAARRFSEALAGILAHELAHATFDLTCGAPSPTHERGDDIWTAQERAGAFAIAALLTTEPRVASADRAASSLLIDAGLDPRGSAAWLTFVDAITRSTRAGTLGPLPVYARLHARASTRTR